MQYLNNYTNIILLCVCVVLILLYFFIKIKIKVVDYHVDKTIDFINNDLKYLVSVFAKIRAGKTSFVNAIAHYKEEQLYKECMQFMFDTINLLPNTDFYNVNLFICDYCSNDDSFYSNWEKIVLELINKYNIKDGIVNDFINCKSVYEVLVKYVECYYVCFYRGIYVYTKNWRYSFYSNTNSVYLDDEAMSIKETINNHNFNIRNWSIIIEDELSLIRGNILSNSKNAKDNGKKEFKSLFGHIFEETVYYYSIKQRNDDEISSDRNLYTNYVCLENRKVINVYSLFIAFFDFKRRLLLFRYKLYYLIKKFFNKKFEDKYCEFDAYIFSTECKFRKKSKRYDNAVRFFKSLGIVKVKLTEYERLSDVGKKDYGNIHYVYFPLRYSIGNYDTHEYKFVRDMLYAISENCNIEDNSYFKNDNIKNKMASFIYDHEEK